MTISNVSSDTEKKEKCKLEKKHIANRRYRTATPYVVKPIRTIILTTNLVTRRDIANK